MHALHLVADWPYSFAIVIVIDKGPMDTGNCSKLPAPLESLASVQYSSTHAVKGGPIEVLKAEMKSLAKKGAMVPACGSQVH